MSRGRLLEVLGNVDPRGMIARCRASDCTTYTEPGLRVTANPPLRILEAAAFLCTRYCAANTNGTFTVVAPDDGGNDQLRTRLSMQVAKPR